MRNNSANRRSRGRGGNQPRRGGNNRSQVFDSNGPDVRIRGTAHQVNEKYLALAKDATSSGDFVLAESYFQHAEHYQRLINIWNKEDEENSGPQHNNSHNNSQSHNSNSDESDESDEAEAGNHNNNNNTPPSQEKPKPASRRVKIQDKDETSSKNQKDDDLGLPQSMIPAVPKTQDKAMEDV